MLLAFHQEFMSNGRKGKREQACLKENLITFVSNFVCQSETSCRPMLLSTYPRQRVPRVVNQLQSIDFADVSLGLGFKFIQLPYQSCDLHKKEVL